VPPGARATNEPGTRALPYSPRPNRYSPVLSDTDGAPPRATCVLFSISPLSHPVEFRRDPVDRTHFLISAQFTAFMEKNSGLGAIQKTILRKLEKKKIRHTIGYSRHYAPIRAPGCVFPGGAGSYHGLDCSNAKKEIWCTTAILFRRNTPRHH